MPSRASRSDTSNHCTQLFQRCAEKNYLSSSSCASHRFCHAACCDRICDMGGDCCMTADTAKERSVVKPWIIFALFVMSV